MTRSRSSLHTRLSLLNIWLARFYPRLIALRWNSELGSQLFNLLVEDVQLELEASIRRFAKNAGELPALLQVAVSGIISDRDIDALKMELRELPKLDFIRFLGLIHTFDKEFNQATFMQELLEAYWIPPLACLPGEGTIEARVAVAMAPLDHLRTMFELSNTEIMFLMHLYCIENDSLYASYFDFATTSEALDTTASMLGITVSEAKNMIPPHGTLRAQGILLEGGSKHHTLLLDSGVKEFLSGAVLAPYPAIYEKCGEALYDLDAYGLEQEKAAILRSLLTSTMPRHILVYGMPGPGTYEFSKALLMAAQKKGIVIHLSARDEADDVSLIALASLAIMAQEEDAVLILDESDTILAPDQSHPSRLSKSAYSTDWLCGYFESLRVSTIWIANDIETIDDSIKRKFHYSMSFDEISLHHKNAVWSNLAFEAGFPTLANHPEIEALLRAYQPSVEDMHALLQTLEGATASHYIARIRIALKERSMLLHGHAHVPEVPVLDEAYDPKALCCSIPAGDLLRAVTGAIAKQRPLTMLFHGDPGTGKTELAKYIAVTAGTSLTLQRASDLFSKYVGETERNIAQMFRNAYAEGTILLLDEADSFLHDRRRSRYLWETTQVNELLTQMEVFPGIFIACTNLTDSLDKAVMRRFSLKVKFEPLDREGRERLFARWFPGVVLSAKEYTRLYGIRHLSPGDFRTVRALLISLERDSAPPEEILDLLASEAGYRSEECEEKPRIGFTI